MSPFSPLRFRASRSSPERAAAESGAPSHATWLPPSQPLDILTTPNLGRASAALQSRAATELAAPRPEHYADFLFFQIGISGGQRSA